MVVAEIGGCLGMTRQSVQAKYGGSSGDQAVGGEANCEGKGSAIRKRVQLRCEVLRRSGRNAPPWRSQRRHRAPRAGTARRPWIPSRISNSQGSRSRPERARRARQRSTLLCRNQARSHSWAIALRAQGRLRLTPAAKAIVTGVRNARRNRRTGLGQLFSALLCLDPPDPAAQLIASLGIDTAVARDRFNQFDPAMPLQTSPLKRRPFRGQDSLHRARRKRRSRRSGKVMLCVPNESLTTEQVLTSM